ncbi:MAG: hypothetical protein BMS9Abin11_1550 [Gammaproteobacteria bacterium]|nr:MAG: hypothetical protein BMS9Abin11_1550 [Gammaproteobacteria bacterium]
MKRRTFLKGTMAGGVIAVAAGAGLLKPTQVMAARWPKSAFKAKAIPDAIKALYGSSNPVTNNRAIKIDAPLQAENGGLVPIKVTANIARVESIAMLVSKNPQPLATSIDLFGAKGFYRANLKMRKSSDLVAIVKAGGKLYKKSHKIKVTVGGCGG